MNKQLEKNLLSILGIISFIGGISCIIPSFYQNNSLLIIVSGLLIVFGVTLLSLSQLN